MVIKKLSFVKGWQWNSRSRLPCMQWNISESQALFWCFVLIILIMASLDTLLSSSLSLTLFLALLLILFFFFQNQGFCSHKIPHMKNRMYMHYMKDNCCEFFSFRKSILSTVRVERKRSHFVHQKIYLFRRVTAQSEMDQGSLWILR